MVQNIVYPVIQGAHNTSKLMQFKFFVSITRFYILLKVSEELTSKGRQECDLHFKQKEIPFQAFHASLKYHNRWKETRETKQSRLNFRDNQIKFFILIIK